MDDQGNKPFRTTTMKRLFNIIVAKLWPMTIPKDEYRHMARAQSIDSYTRSPAVTSKTVERPKDISVLPVSYHQNCVCAFLTFED